MPAGLLARGSLSGPAFSSRWTMADSGPLSPLTVAGAAAVWARLARPAFPFQPLRATVIYPLIT